MIRPSGQAACSALIRPVLSRGYIVATSGLMTASTSPSATPMRKEAASSTGKPYAGDAMVRASPARCATQPSPISRPMPMASTSGAATRIATG